MSKAKKFGVSGLLIGAGGAALLNTVRQLSDDTKPFNFWELLEHACKGGLALGTAGLVVGAIADHENARTKPIDTNAALLHILSKIKLNPEGKQHKSCLKKAEWLKAILQKEFGTELKESPFIYGSCAKGVAIKDKSDIDICLSFKSGSFSSLEDMFFTVAEVLDGYVGSHGLIKVRKQKVSIGAFFRISEHEFKIDIVPNKLSRSKRSDSAGYLFVNNNGIFETYSRKKTDIKLLQGLHLSAPQKNILMLMKNWKHKRSIPLTSHLLQYLIIDAYRCNRGSIPRPITDKLIMVVRHIYHNIDIAIITSIENTNNILTDIPEADIIEIKRVCKKLIDQYEYQPNSIYDEMR